MEHAIPADTDCARRVISLERCFNFRDVGGYETAGGRRVRRRRLFRSMTPEYATPRDVEVMRDLGLRLVVDLRGRRYKSSGPLGEEPMRRVAVGDWRLVAPTEEARQAYSRLQPEQALPLVLERMGRAYAKAASAIASEEGPALVHCRLGKDRTGVFVALVLRLLGVSEEQVLEDYLLSDRYIGACRVLLAEVEPPGGYAGRSIVANEPPSRAAMQAVLRALEHDHGGALAYLRAHGLRKRDAEALAEKLLE